MTFEIPFLIEPNDVVIEQCDGNISVFDANAREPVGQVMRADSVTLQAQVVVTQWSAPAWKLGGQGGVSEASAGHLAFLYRDLVAAGVTLRRGDRITSIAGDARNLYLTRRRLTGHLSGVTNVEVWDFEDKKPSKL